MWQMDLRPLSFPSWTHKRNGGMGHGTQRQERNVFRFSETSVYLSRVYQPPFQKNYLLQGSHPLKEKDGSYLGRELRLAFLIFLVIWELYSGQLEYICSFTSCPCNDFVQMVFSYYFCFAWFQRSFTMSSSSLPLESLLWRSCLPTPPRWWLRQLFSVPLTVWQTFT